MKMKEINWVGALLRNLFVYKANKCSKYNLKRLGWVCGL